MRQSLMDGLSCPRRVFPVPHERILARKGLWIPAAARKTVEAPGEHRSANANVLM